MNQHWSIFLANEATGNKGDYNGQESWVHVRHINSMGQCKKIIINIYMCGLHYIALLSVFLLSSSIKQGNIDGPDGFPWKKLVDRSMTKLLTVLHTKATTLVVLGSWLRFTICLSELNKVLMTGMGLMLININIQPPQTRFPSTISFFFGKLIEPSSFNHYE